MGWSGPLLDIVADASDKRLPETTRSCVATLGAQLQMLKTQILQFDKSQPGIDPTRQAKRHDAIPGVGPASALALVAWHGRPYYY